MSNTRNQSNHVTILAALLVAALALVIACAGPATAEALPATGVPPTEKSAPPVGPTTTEPESGETSDITGIVWQWASLVETEPSGQSVVPDPAKYTFLLRNDGTADITADCNKVSGSYSLDGNMLTISTLGPSTLAFCGEESLDQQYLQVLDRVESFTVDAGELQLDLVGGAGTVTLVE
jgi:heat shock protein HslJ